MDSTEGLEITVGGQSRSEVIRSLDEAGVQLNVHAETLLGHAAFGDPQPQTLRIVERTVAQLGLPEGGGQPQVYATAQAMGLQLCPLVTGPTLRLALLDQVNAPDSVLSAGRAPTGSMHIASAPVSEDVDYPKGFYLRVVDGVSWLRGYRCDDEYVWTPEVRLAFVLPTNS